MPVSKRQAAITVALILSLILFAGSAWAGPRDHDGGFFLRMSAGFGGASTEIKNFPVWGDLKFSGVSGDVNFAIGGIVARNLALHGTLWGWTLTDPDLKTENFGSGQASGNLSVSGIGGGITYFFMPVNIYISPSVGVAVLSAEGYDSDAGFAFDFTLGKEWWIGNRWGMGLSGAFGYHSIPENEINENYSGPSFALRFSVTYN